MDMKAFSDENVARCTAPNGFNMALDRWTLSDWMVATVGELGEAANVLKKMNRLGDGIPGNKEPPEALKGMFADELADTYIYLDLMCRAAGLEAPWQERQLQYGERTLSDHMTAAAAALGHAAGLVMLQRLGFGHPALREYLEETCTMLRIIAEVADIDFEAAIRNKFDRTSATMEYANG